LAQGKDQLKGETEAKGKKGEGDVNTIPSKGLMGSDRALRAKTEAKGVKGEGDVWRPSNQGLKEVTRSMKKTPKA
jgi:hypothetical protein